MRVAHAVLHVHGVAERAQDRSAGERVDILVYLLWAAVLLVLLRYL